MSDRLEKLIATLSPGETAKLLSVTHEIANRARLEWNVDVPVDDIAALVQCRDATFRDAGLDEADISNALYNLRQNSETVKAHLADTAGSDAAKKLGADPAVVKFDGETLMQISTPSRRMALARKHGVGEIPAADRGQRRENIQTTAREYDTVAETKEVALQRLNKARGI